MDAITVTVGDDHFAVDHTLQVAVQRSLDGEPEDKIFSSCRAADGGKRHRFPAFVEKLK
jgi:hypothetical protein